jgi:hypothetical protein
MQPEAFRSIDLNHWEEVCLDRPSHFKVKPLLPPSLSVTFMYIDTGSKARNCSLLSEWYKQTNKNWTAGSLGKGDPNFRDRNACCF